MKALSLFSGIGGKSVETRKKMSDSAKNRCTPEWRKKKSEMYSTKLDLEKVKDLYNSGMSQHELAKELGVSQKVIWRFMKNNEITSRPAIKRNQTGSKNDYWKGGRTETAAGYILIRMPEHPRSSANNGYVFEHIVVAEKKIGRSLLFFGVDHPESEIVHHKNENKKDNDPENLEVMTLSEHVKLHNAIRRGGGSNAKIKQNASA